MNRQCYWDMTEHTQKHFDKKKKDALKVEIARPVGLTWAQQNKGVQVCLSGFGWLVFSSIRTSLFSTYQKTSGAFLNDQLVNDPQQN